MTIWLPLSFPVERDRALGHQEPHWKEFHFDLTQIPAGEAVTAAEFRVYKLPSTRPLNSTLRIRMFQVVQEHSNRCLPLAQAPSPLVGSFVTSIWQCGLPLLAGRGIFQRRKGKLPGRRASEMGKMLGRKVPALPSCCGPLVGHRATESVSHMHSTMFDMVISEIRHRKSSESGQDRRPRSGPLGGMRHRGIWAALSHWLIVLSCPQGV